MPICTSVLSIGKNRVLFFIIENDLRIHEVELSSTGIQEEKIVLENENLGAFTDILAKVLPIVSGE